jgi:hypothetical protein
MGKRELHNGELHGLYSSTDIIRMMKSGRMGWPWPVSGTAGSFMQSCGSRT